MNELAVTLEHIRQAAEWAQTALQAQEAQQMHPLDGHWRAYNQRTWDCGTACCIWGAAHLLATGEPDPAGPGHAWAGQSRLHSKVWLLLIRPYTRPSQVLELLE